MPDKFILKGREVVPVEDTIEWAKAFESGNRRVALDTVGTCRVSTAFLGLDFSFGRGVPLLFETMTFSEDEALDGYQARYMTYDEAEAGHAKVVAALRAGQFKKDATYA